MMHSTTTCYRGHRFGDAIPLTTSQRDILIAGFRSRDDAPPEVLGGRQAVQRIDLAGVGPVVVKQFARGGLVRHFNRQTHVRWGPTRCAREMNWLQRALQLGLFVPQPVTWCDDGGRLVYRCWLVTKTVPNTVSLAQVGLQDPDRLIGVFPGVNRQMTILIDNHIHHKDMHPGNILVDDTGKVFFLDFDKATAYRGSRRRLAARYLHRWRKAVNKYGLPQKLIRCLEEELVPQWKI